MVIVVKNGKCEIRRSNSGSLVRSIGSGNVIQAAGSDSLDLVAVTYTNGTVDLRSMSNGTLKRSFKTGPYTAVSFEGDTVVLQLGKGGAEVRRVSTGSLVRKIS